MHGAIRIRSLTRPPLGIADYPRWWIGRHSARSEDHRVVRCWRHGRAVLALLEGVSDRSQADALRGLRIFVPLAEARRAAAPDETLWHDLVGCRVITVDGAPLGRVTKLEDYGASDILVVYDDTHEGEWMIPFTEEMIIRADIATRTITVSLLEGMDACFTPSS